MTTTQKERMRARAKDQLSRLKPMADWLADLSDARRESAIQMFGSPEACYEVLRKELLAEAEEPSPNAAKVGPDGKVQFLWER